MRILTISHFYESHGGGIERVAAHLSRQFAALGHDACWAASDADPPPEAPVASVPLACIDPLEKLTGLPMPLPRPRALVALARAIRACDAVVIHDALYATSCVAAVLARFWGKPIVLIQHIGFIPFANPVPRAAMKLANLLIARPMMRFCGRLVFISDAVRREWLGDPPRRHGRLLFNGVDKTIFFPGPADRSAFGLPTNRGIVLFVGRFVEKKGLHILRATARLRPDLIFVLVGSGPIRPDAWGLANVHVLGILPQPLVAELQRCADFLALPSIGEGFPLVIQEAMACGLPVICGQDSARADPEARRWLAPVDIDPAAPEQTAQKIAAAIDTLTMTPPQRADMAAYAAQAYDWRRMAQALIQLLTV